jgi:hypothetical protein
VIETLQDRPKVSAAAGSADNLANAGCVSRSHAMPQQVITTHLVSVVIDSQLVDARQRPSARPETHGQFELLKSMEVPIREVPCLPDRAGPVNTSAVETIHKPGLAVPIALQTHGANLKICIVQVHLPNRATHPGAIVMSDKEINPSANEVARKDHVTVYKAEALSLRELKGELCSGSATAFRGVRELHDANRIFAGNLNRAVSRAAVSQNHFPIVLLGDCKRTLNTGRDPPLFIESLNPNR